MLNGWEYPRHANDISAIALMAAILMPIPNVIVSPSKGVLYAYTNTYSIVNFDRY